MRSHTRVNIMQTQDKALNTKGLNWTVERPMTFQKDTDSRRQVDKLTTRAEQSS